MDLFKNIFKPKKGSSSILLSISNILSIQNVSHDIIIENQGAILLKSSEIVSGIDFDNKIRQHINQEDIQGLSELKFINDEHDIKWLVLRTKTTTQLINSIDVISNFIASLNAGDSMIGAVFISNFKEHKSYIICNYRTSKFYPFIPDSKKSRNNELEIDLGHQLELNGVPVEDHENWYALWDAVI